MLRLTQMRSSCCPLKAHSQLPVVERVAGRHAWRAPQEKLFSAVGAAGPGLGPGMQPAFPPSFTRLNVVCNGNRGVFIVERQVIVCLCSQCAARAAQMGLPEMELSPTDFERHSGRCLH